LSKAIRVLEDTVLADAAFEASGDTLEEVFEAATQAVIELMADPETVSSDWHQDVVLVEEDVPSLLFEWLSHLVFLKDAQSVVFQKAPMTVCYDQTFKRWTLKGTVIGEHINQSRQTLRSDIKAVTKHQYSLAEKDGRWVARVVLDL
jgi:SHS2 domain-containing protein